MGNKLAVAFFCIGTAAIGYLEYRQTKRNAVLLDAVAANAKTSADINKRLDGIEETFNSENAVLDIETAAKAWQQDMDNIMNYSIKQAMEGVNGG